MYTAILVDDERIVLDTLANYMDWASMHIQVVATSGNGKDALEKVAALRPDILITDVKMPFMDGIELAQRVHALFPEIQIVFLSGYNEFEYARSALQAGAGDYLLKPVDPAELACSMQTVCARCEERKNRQVPSLFVAGEYIRELIQVGGSLMPGLADEVCQIINRYLGLDPHRRAYHFTLIHINEYTLLSEYIFADSGLEKAGGQMIELETYIKCLPGTCGGLITQIKEDCWLYTAPAGRYGALLEWRGGCPEGRNWISILGIGEAMDFVRLTMAWPEITAQYKQALTVLGPGFSIPDHRSFQPLTRKDALPPVEALVLAVSHNDREGLARWLGSFYDFGVPPGGIKQLLADTMGFFEALQASPAIKTNRVLKVLEDDAAFIGRLSVMESAKSMKTLMLQMITALMDALHSGGQSRHGAMVAEVLAIAGEEYATPLSVESIAERVYLSPNYLSAIFREETGHTILEHITKVRMEAAAGLLRSSGFKIHEIARRVGYESPSYFSSVFFKNYGVPPNQYRLRVRGQADETN